MKQHITIVLLFICLLAHAQEAGKEKFVWRKSTQLEIPRHSFTADEWKEMTKDDEVKKFCDRVNAAAVIKDYWKDDFRRALYDAFNEEYGRYMMARYNNGNPFIVTGDPWPDKKNK